MAGIGRTLNIQPDLVPKAEVKQQNEWHYKCKLQQTDIMRKVGVHCCVGGGNIMLQVGRSQV
jgi:hypothetical protein